MNDRKQKLMMRLPAILLLAATLLFWGLYDRYEPVGPNLLQSPSLADATRIRGDCAETNDVFRLTVHPGGKTAGIHFRLPNGAAYDWIRLRGRIKADGVEVGKHSWNCVRLVLSQFDRKSKWVPVSHVVEMAKGTTDWIYCERVFELDPRAVNVDVELQQIGSAGTAEFDQIMAQPVRFKPFFNGWRIIFGGLWLAMGVLYFRRCRLNRRPLKVLILINAVAILFGTLMPGKWIEDTTKYAKKEASRMLEHSRPSRSTPSSVSKKKGPRKERGTDFIEQFDEMVDHTHSLGHFTLFTSLCFLVLLSAALERQRRSYFFKVAGDIMLFAAITEALQFLTIDRDPGIVDWFTDFRGMLTASLLFLVVKLWLWVRTKRASRAVN